MAIYRSDVDQWLWWVFDGYGDVIFPWARLFSGQTQSNDTVIINSAPTMFRTGAALVDLFGHSSSGLPQSHDHVIFGQSGNHVMALRNVEYVSTYANNLVDFYQLDHFGFTTDGSIRVIEANIGNHLVTFETAARDSSLNLGKGFDRVIVVDDPDIGISTFWTIRREFDNSVKAFALSTGNMVKIEGGDASHWATNPGINYGDVERLTYTEFRTGSEVDLYLGKGDIGSPYKRAGFENIDLSTYDMSSSPDTFLHSSFGSINFSSRNVFVGAAVIEEWNGTEETAEQQSEAYRFSTASILAVDHNHDLLVSEQIDEIDGHLRLYSRDETSRTYNRFNEVYLGTAGDDINSNNGATTSRNGTTEKIVHTALYGFGGNDSLEAGSGNDYLFGGESTYTTKNPVGLQGNRIIGGNGADYFGVGNISAGNDGDAIMTTDFTSRLSGSAPLTSDPSGLLFASGSSETADLKLRVATDVIEDWTHGVDNLRVLGNGTAVINGLGTENGTVGLSYKKHTIASDTISSDDDLINLSGAKVVNDGKIVARGMGGDDTLIGSSGQDWLYGNAGSNIVVTGSSGSNGGDRVFFDTRSGRQYVDDFTVGTDKFYVAKNVIDAFTGGASRSLSPVNAATSSGDGKFIRYTAGESYDQNVTFIHSPIYKAMLSGIYGAGPYTNEQYYRTEFFADLATTGAGKATIAIGSALLAIPFVGPALAVPFYVLGAIFKSAQQFSNDWNPLSLIPANPILNVSTDYSAISGDQYKYGQTILGSGSHLNAVYQANTNFSGSYVYTLQSTSSWASTGTTPATETTTGADNKKFLDFFEDAYTNDGFIPVLEVNPGLAGPVYGYFAVHSANETFVYLVLSDDNLIENGEAILVAEIEGKLNSSDFAVYDSSNDIYNAGSDAPVVLVSPTIVDVLDGSNVSIPNKARTFDDDSTVRVSISGTVPAGTVVKIYDANDIDPGTNAPRMVGQTIAAGDNPVVSIADTRKVGQVLLQTDYDVPTPDANGDFPTDPGAATGNLRSLELDNTFEYLDQRIFYYAVVENNIGDGIVLERRSNTWEIRASGLSDASLDGGNGFDTLFLSATSAHLNTVADNKLINVEAIRVKDPLPPILALVVNASGTITGINILEPGSDLANGEYDLSFTNGSGTAGSGATGWKAVVSGGRVTSIVAGSSGGTGYDLDDEVSASWGMLPVLIDLRNQTDGFDIFASTGNDTIYGSLFADTVNNGDDVINGGAGADYIDAGSGDDTIVYNSQAGLSEDLTVIGGSGTDTLRFDTGTAPLTLNSVHFAKVREMEVLALNGTGTQQLTLGSATDAAFTSGITITTVATAASLDLQGASSTVKINATGTDNGDTLVGGSANDTLSGGNGNDTLTGNAGADSLIGGAGNDLYIFTANPESGDVITEDVSGGSADALYANGSALNMSTLSINGLTAGGSLQGNGGADEGIDVVVIKSGETATFAAAQLAGTDVAINEDVNGQNTTLNISGATGTQSFAGLTFVTISPWNGFDNAADNVVINVAATGINNITGTSISDRIVAGTQAGTLTIDGGSGTDTLEATSDLTVNGWTSVENLVLSNNGTDVTIASSLLATAGLTSVSGNTDGASLERLIVNAGNGGETIDLSTVSFTNAAVSLNGGAGNDILSTNNGDDTIVSGGGSNTIDAGTGADTVSLTGASGNDLIKVASGDGADAGVNSGWDIITGFEGADTAGVTVDRIEITGWVDRSTDTSINNIEFFGFDGTNSVAATSSNLGYATATVAGSPNVAVIDETELLVVTDSSVTSLSDAAAALEAAYDLSNLDPGQVIFSVKGSGTNEWWYGLYQHPSGYTNGSLSASNLQILGVVTTTTGTIFGPDTFWQPGVLLNVPEVYSLAVLGETGGVNLVSDQAGSIEIGTADTTAPATISADTLTALRAQTTAVQGTISVTNSFNIVGFARSQFTGSDPTLITAIGTTPDLIGTTYALGTTGNDTLTSGADYVWSYDGNDLLDGTYVWGGNGNDTIIGSESDQTLDGGSGTDVLRIGANFDDANNNQIVSIEKIELTADNLTLSIADQSEGIEITGFLSGSSNITGGEGSDTLIGGSGVDTLAGGNGGDVFIIGAAADHSGTEIITGGNGSDTIRFTSATANETLTLSANVTDSDQVLNIAISDAAGNSSGTTDLNVTAVNLTGTLAVNLVGNEGENHLTGTVNVDTISGGGGNDTILGGAGADSLIGGSGNDTFLFVNQAELISGSTLVDATISGESGTDRISVDGGLTVAISDSWSKASSIEELYVTGTAASSIVLGTTADTLGIATINISSSTTDGNVVDASAYNSRGVAIAGSSSATNSLTGTSRNDTIIGGTDNDTIVSGTGNDSINTSDGDDEIRFAINNLDANDTVTGGADTDQITLITTGSLGDGDFTRVTQVERLVLADGGANTIILAGSAEAAGIVTVVGGDNNDVVNAGAYATAALYIDGDDGNDTLTGGNGADTLLGGEGSDVFVYQSIDRLLVAGQVVDTVTGGNGTDTIRIDQSTTYSIALSDSFARVGTVETLAAGVANTGNISIILNDDAFDTAGIRTVTLAADTSAIGANTIDASAANSNQSITLIGSFGVDTITGGQGNDSISAGGGNDALTGGLGIDTFEVGSGTDTIADLGQGGADALIVANGAAALATIHTDWSATADTRNLNTYTNVTITTSGLDVDLISATVVSATIGGFTVTNIGGSASIQGSDAADLITLGDFGDSAYGAEGNDTIVGGNAADRILGDDGNDSLSGGNGDDTLSGSDGNDTLAGGDGNDLIGATGANPSPVDEDGNDSITGGAGDDTIFAGSGSDTVEGGAGADLIYVGASDSAADLVILNAVVGSSSDSNRVIVDGNGNDGGEDELNEFNFSQDTIRVVASNVNIFDHALNIHQGTADGGNDGSIGSFSTGTWLINLSGADSVIGAGDIAIGITNPPPSNLVAFQSRLQYDLTGTSGNDTLKGGSLDDTITSGGGNDLISGGSGDDVFRFAPGGFTSDDTIEGGSGSDKIEFTGSGHSLTSANFSNTTNIEAISFETGTNSLTLDSVASSAFSDVILTITGGNGDDTINTDGLLEQVSIVGGVGNDNITGTAQNDTLSGGEGNDTLVGGNGNDSISGGNGNDSFLFGDGEFTSSDTVKGENGTDTIAMTADSQTIDAEDFDNKSGFEAITLANGNNSLTMDDSVTASFSDVIVTITGGNGTDVIDITGFGRRTSIVSGEGDDAILGGELNDTIVGGGGLDSLSGGNGNDLFIVQLQSDLVAGEYYDGADGNDTLLVQGGGDFTGVQINSIETITAASGVDLVFDASELSGEVISINGTGNNFGETLTVNGTASGETINLSNLTLDANDFTGVTVNALGGADTVTATSADDTIDGGDGNDLINGAAGNDSLLGGNGDDTLIGGIGRDTLVGGAGADVYQFSTADATTSSSIADVDKIVGFDAGTDSIALITNGTISGVTVTAVAGNGGDNDYVVSWIDGGNRYYLYLEDATVTDGLEFSVTTSGTTTTLSAPTGAPTFDVFNVTSSGVTVSGSTPYRAYFHDAAYDPVKNDRNTTSDIYTVSQNLGASANFTFASTVIGSGDGTLRTGEMSLINTNSGALSTSSVLLTVGSNLADITSGGSQSIIIYGFGGDDSLVGSAQTAGSQDTIFGGDGNDTIDGVSGNDVLWGGNGNDTIYWENDSISEGVTVYGGLGDDFLDSDNGDIGFDLLFGDEGNDTIFGGGGEDTIYGGAGDDRLVGEGGNDVLVGGAGSDVFVVNTVATSGVDTISDFDWSFDKIDTPFSVTYFYDSRATIGSLDYRSTFEDALNTAASLNGSPNADPDNSYDAIVFEFNSRSYILITLDENDGTPVGGNTYNASTDILIDITGAVGTKPYDAFGDLTPGGSNPFI